MLESLSVAIALATEEVEILCSWNGSDANADLIENRSGYEFLIAQQKPYHFASNMNQLATQANGDVLALINDDVVLDAGSLDSGLNCLITHGPSSLIGALLRTPDGRLQHMGFCFDINHNPYHILEGTLDASEATSDGIAFEVPAVTAAVVLMQRDTFLKLRFNETYQRCGEDVELNLDLRQSLLGQVLLCPEMSGIHAESSTRQELGESGSTSQDLVQMRARRRLFLEQASSTQLLVELRMANRERMLNNRAIQRQLQEIDQQRQTLELDSQLSRLQKDRDHWRRQAQMLQLEALRLQDSVQRQQGV